MLNCHSLLGSHLTQVKRQVVIQWLSIVLSKADEAAVKSEETTLMMYQGCFLRFNGAPL